MSQLEKSLMEACYVEQSEADAKPVVKRTRTSPFDQLNSPKLQFALSQMCQLDWMKQRYPEFYARLKGMIRLGRVEIVGGSWTEMDGNIPDGESFVRQLLYGQQFCRAEFGLTCDTFWLPDTFGYSAQFPQILNGAGMKGFLTQKMSWSLVNKFPHHTFRWVGLDGSEVLTHFPPADTYCSELRPADVRKSTESFQDHGRTKDAILLYGHGDGGGGPDWQMMERLKRLTIMNNSNIAGLMPRVISSTVKQFFDKIEKDRPNLCTWSGELYLELHNGTYTTHARVKKRNRMLESLLRDIELLQCLMILSGVKSAPDNIDECWKKLMLNQFHDVLPGTSIGAVYTDAHQLYDEIEETCRRYFKLTTEPKFYALPPDPKRIVLNQLPWTRPWYNGQWYRLPPLSISDARANLDIYEPSEPSFVGHVTQRMSNEPTLADGTFAFLENAFIIVGINKSGCITDLRLKNDSMGYNYIGE